MTEGGFDYFGQRDWLKRIHQLKQEFRSATSEPRLKIPESAQADGTDLNPKRGRYSSQQPALKARSRPRSPIASRHRGLKKEAG